MTKRALLGMVAVLGATGCMNSCKETGGGGGTRETVAKLNTFRDEMCKCRDTACAQEVSNRMSAWNTARAGGGKLTLSEADAKAAQKASDELGSCMLKALSTGSAAAPGSAASGSADSTPPEGSDAGSAAMAAGSADGDIPQECKDYKAAVERIASCDAIPQAARDTLRTSFEKASAGWQKLGSRDHLKPSCTSATEAVTAVGRQKCGWQ